MGKKILLLALFFSILFSFVGISSASSLGDCTFSAIDSTTGTVSGLSCPTASGSLYTEYVNTEPGFLKLAYQDNHGVYYFNQNVFGLLVVVATVTVGLFFSLIALAIFLFKWGYNITSSHKKS